MKRSSYIPDVSYATVAFASYNHDVLVFLLLWRTPTRIRINTLIGEALGGKTGSSDFMFASRNSACRYPVCASICVAIRQRMRESSREEARVLLLTPVYMSNTRATHDLRRIDIALGRIDGKEKRKEEEMPGPRNVEDNTGIRIG